MTWRTINVKPLLTALNIGGRNLNREKFDILTVLLACVAGIIKMQLPAGDRVFNRGAFRSPIAEEIGLCEGVVTRLNVHIPPATCREEAHRR